MCRSFSFEKEAWSTFMLKGQSKAIKNSTVDRFLVKVIKRTWAYEVAWKHHSEKQIQKILSQQRHSRPCRVMIVSLSFKLLVKTRYLFARRTLWLQTMRAVLLLQTRWVHSAACICVFTCFRSPHQAFCKHVLHRVWLPTQSVAKVKKIL